jgi:hypothetical protein
MSIRKAEVESLARKLSDRTGYSMTETIEKALEAMDSSCVAESRVRYTRLLGISSRCASLPDLDTRSEDDILGYNPEGLS